MIPRYCTAMVAPARPQRERLTALLKRRGMARLSEIRKEGITATTVSRMEREGAVLRLGRGLYQLPDAPVDTQHTLAEAAKRVPRGVIALTSALAFHGLTDQQPRKVWMAIGPKDWAPKGDDPPLRIVRFSEPYLSSQVKTHKIEGVPVKVYDVAKTIADMFRHRKSVGLSVAIEGLREALRQRKTTPAALARAAVDGGVAKVMTPYLEALTHG
jgi:predicted transcriptional regulator of viral defense system